MVWKRYGSGCKRRETLLSDLLADVSDNVGLLCVVWLAILQWHLLTRWHYWP